MDAAKRARINGIVGCICLGVALLNATLAVLAMVAEKNVHKGAAGIAIAASLAAVGIVCLSRGKLRRPPNA